MLGAPLITEGWLRVAAETGFLIDGKVYEVPMLDSLTMGERRVMYDLSGITQEDFFRAEDEDEDEHDARVGKLVRHPGYMEALMQVAYQRGNPGLKQSKVRFVIEGTNFYEAVATLGVEDEPEEDAVPLALTTPPGELSPNGSSSSNDLSRQTSAPGGTDSPNDSDEPGSDQSLTGTMRSGTSSISGQEISAA